MLLISHRHARVRHHAATHGTAGSVSAWTMRAAIALHVQNFREQSLLVQEEKTSTDDGIGEKDPCSDHQSAEVWEGWEIDMNNCDMTGIPVITT